MSRFRPLHSWVLFAVCVLSACDKVPLTSPTGSTISLSTNSNIVPINGSVEVTATVIESAGTAVQNGTTVVFTSDFGRMDPAEAQTQNGRATVRFVASGQSGSARVNAFSGAASTSGGTTSGALTLLVGGAAAGRIVARAEPPTIPQAGGTTQVFANVADTNGNPLSGAPVTFTIGGTTGTGVLGSPSTVTDVNGQAQTSLTTNQTTTVTATVATTTTAAITANVVVTAVPAPSIAISSCTAAPAVGVAVNCTVTPTVPPGGSAIQNVTVNWGDGTGEQPFGNVTGATVVSHTYSAPNTYTVTASATDLNGQRGTAVATVVVQIIRPTITISTTSATGSVGVAMSFTVTPALTPPQPITNVTVDFGDGTSRNLGVISSATTIAKTFRSEGTFTVIATVTDQSGQRGTGTTQVVIGRSSAPTITTFSQTSNVTPPAVSGGPAETFSVVVSAGTGLSIRSVVVTKHDGEELFNSTTGGTFATTRVSAGDILTLRVTDSAGNAATSQLVVQ